ncbi:MAG: hypothetical protein AB8C02_05130, partial [Halioglobus sp.]
SAWEVGVGEWVLKTMAWLIYCRLGWLFSHSLSVARGGLMFRRAEWTVVAGVSALGEQVVGFGVGQGTPRRGV